MADQEKELWQKSFLRRLAWECPSGGGNGHVLDAIHEAVIRQIPNEDDAIGPTSVAACLEFVAELASNMAKMARDPDFTWKTGRSLERYEQEEAARKSIKRAVGTCGNCGGKTKAI